MMSSIPLSAGTSRLLSLRVLLVAGLLLGLALPAFVHPPEAAAQVDRHAALRQRLQSKLDSLRTSGRFPGATFAVMLGDGAVISVATGMSDTTARMPMKTSDLMPQGSVGKTYVSALAMQLVHEGKLDINAPIARYLGMEPWFVRLPNGAAITVRHLMTHSSGLVRYEFNPKFTADLSAAPADRTWNPHELIAYMFDAPAPFKPGQGWEYSDTNFMVLGLILEKITGMAMIDAIQKRVVQPLGLSQTVPNLAPRVPGVVQGYAGPRNPFGGNDAMLSNGRFSFNPQFEWAGGGWSSTTSDLARWGKALYEWKAFDQSVAARFLDGIPSRLGANVRYGLGVIISPAPTVMPALGESLGHSGYFPGYQTELRYYPAHKFSAALQVNSSNGRVMPQGMNMGSAIAALSALVIQGGGE